MIQFDSTAKFDILVPPVVEGGAWVDWSENKPVPWEKKTGDKDTFKTDTEMTATGTFRISNPDGSPLELKVTRNITFTAEKDHLILWDTILTNLTPEQIIFQVKWDQLYLKNESQTFQEGQSIHFTQSQMTVKYTGSSAANILVRRSPNYSSLTSTLISDPTTYSKPVIGQSSKWEKNSGIEFLKPASIKYLDGAVIMTSTGRTLVYPRSALVLHPSGQIILPLTSSITALYKSASSLATQPSAITELFTSRNILTDEQINFYTANHIQFRNQIDVEFLTATST